MLYAVTTGAYYPPVDTTWKILTTGASQLTTGALCTVRFSAKKVEETQANSSNQGRISNGQLIES